MHCVISFNGVGAMSDLDVPEPYTNRTADDVRTNMRVGDMLCIDQDGRQLTVRAFKVDGGFNIHLGGTSYHWADAWMAETGTVAVPRCLALDPQIGDTYQRDQHQEEVYAVDKHWVCTLDLYGATYKHTRKSWADGARTWTSCRDREGGVRFDPQVGDRIITANGVVAFHVSERQGNLLLLDDGRPVSLDLWSRAASGIFPTRYARLVAAGDPA